VPYLSILWNLQAIAGIDEMAVAMLLVEIGDDMSALRLYLCLISKRIFYGLFRVRLLFASRAGHLSR